eukprot:9466978-Lingulodinium_polyedra.AAC.1
MVYCDNINILAKGARAADEALHKVEAELEAQGFEAHEQVAACTWRAPSARRWTVRRAPCGWKELGRL